MSGSVISIKNASPAFLPSIFHIGNWHTVSFKREKTLLVSRFNKKCRLNEPVRQTKEMRDVIK